MITYNNSKRRRIYHKTRYNHLWYMNDITVTHNRMQYDYKWKQNSDLGRWNIKYSRKFFNEATLFYLHWKMAMNISESLFVRRTSGSSLKYVFTMSAMSHTPKLEYCMSSSPISWRSRNFCMRDLTPGFLKMPTWKTKAGNWNKTHLQ